MRVHTHVHTHTRAHTGFSYCHPGISPKLDAKSAILSESLDSFSWGTWCHPSDELQPAAWQANPAKAINYFEQFAHQLHSARRPTLFSFLCPGSYHPLSAPRASTYVYIRGTYTCAHATAYTHNTRARDSFVCRCAHDAHTRGRTHPRVRTYTRARHGDHVCYWSFNEGTE